MSTDYEALRNQALAGLEAICGMQERGASALPASVRGHDRSGLRTAALGLMVEVGELLQAAEWKPWREPRPTDKARLVDETADVLHFVGWLLNNIMAREGITIRELADGFVAKHLENVRRFTGQVPGHEPPGHALQDTHLSYVGVGYGSTGTIATEQPAGVGYSTVPGWYLVNGELVALPKGGALAFVPTDEVTYLGEAPDGMVPCPNGCASRVEDGKPYYCTIRGCEVGTPGWCYE